jgi:SAM-dependent methyltransferase
MYRIRDIAREFLVNTAMGFAPIRALKIRRGRTSLADLESEAEKIIAEFTFFMDTIGWNRVAGKTVLEIGPGDAVPLAFLFIGAGARRYIAFDHFMGDVLSPAAVALYEALALRAPAKIQARWNDAGVDISAPGLQSFVRSGKVSLVRRPIEESVESVAADYIVSFNVLEHLSSVGRALKNMHSMLLQDGIMVHRVDYGPHDIWASYKNPLVFLTVPESLWRVIGSNRTYSNRVRHAEVLKILSGLGMKTADRVTRIASADDTDAVLGRLPEDLAQFKSDELAVLDAEFASSKGPIPILGHPFRVSTP